MDEQLDALVAELQERKIDRRTFMQRAAALGGGAAAGAGAGSAAAQTTGGQADSTGAAPGDAAAGTGLLARLSQDLAAAVERAAAGTVTVNARRRFPASGIVWSADGLVVTANHVVERDEDITLGLPDGRTVPAKLVGRDPGSDLALLKAEASDLTPAPRATGPVKVGHLVLAVARPGASGPMSSFGAVTVVGGPWRTAQGGTVEGFIRADVAMLPGFSGGPLVDAEGNVVGLTSSTLGRGAGLALPVAVIEKIVSSLQAHGKVQRGYLGVGAQAARLSPTIQQALNRTQERGLLVVHVEPDGPAEKEGLLLGDVIVAVNGEPVTEVDELQAKLSGELVGQPIPIQVIRAGQPREIRVTVGSR